MTLVRTKTKTNHYPGLFDNLFFPEFNGWTRGNLISSQPSQPKVNIKEGDHLFMLEIAAPGLEKKDFKIQLDQDLLTVSCDKKEENLKEGERYSKREFSYQTFQRAFTLPENIDAEMITADYHNGLLLIQIPKKEEAKPQPRKSIEVG
jgi:HSP20 family protein